MRLTFLFYYYYLKTISNWILNWRDFIEDKNGKFVWSEKCEQTFQELKKRLLSPSILTLPVMDKKFAVYCDASRQGLRYVLMQEGKVIAYASR